MASYLPPSARMRQIKDAARANLATAEKPVEPEPAPTPAAAAVEPPPAPVVVEEVVKAKPVKEPEPTPAPIPEPEPLVAKEAPVFDQKMKKTDLLAIAQKYGLDVDEKSSKAQVLEALAVRFPW